LQLDGVPIAPRERGGDELVSVVRAVNGGDGRRRSVSAHCK
jgi:hypothetical protein